MIKMHIEVDGIGEMRERLGSLGHKAPSAMADAINRTTADIKKTMAREAEKRYNITSGKVKKTITISKATRSEPQGAAISKASPIALSKFKVSPNRKVTYTSKGRPSPKAYKASVLKGPATKPLNTDPKAFIAVMKSGHKGVFRRTGRWEAAEGNASWSRRTRQHHYIKSGISGKNLRSKHNEIIEELYGPAVPWMIGKSMKFIQEEAKSTLQKRMEAEIENILRKE